MRYVGDPFGLDDAEGEAAQAGDILRARTGTDAAAVLIIVPIEEVVAAILDGPVSPVGLQHPLRIGLFRRTAGDAIGDFMGLLAGFLVVGFAFNDERWADLGKSR